ncbi:MAG: ATP-binding protein, partial [archaeon]|nr:ATP-binding protein [archaeon]
MEFIGREEELEILEREYARRSSFTVVYGRRRVGKTTLVRRFAEGRESLYFLATEESVTENLARFSRMVSSELGFEGIRFARWHDALEAVTRGGKKVIIIDEFPYIASSDPSIPSQFQEIWDNTLKDREVMLILCGSFKGMMERYVLNRTSPLYGRRTATLKLRPLEFKTIRRAYPDRDVRELLEEYACHGGVPKYMEILEGMDLREGILRNIANRNGVLFEEPLFLLNGETRNPVSYISIMNCMAKGNVQLKDIAGSMEVPSNTLTPYL